MAFFPALLRNTLLLCLCAGSPSATAQSLALVGGTLVDGTLKDPIHDKFADKHLAKYETPLVYDFAPRKPAK